MLPERAILFDLDDTLHPLRLFVRSGFAAVAAHLERRHGVDGQAALKTLAGEAVGANRGRELQTLVTMLRLPPSIMPDLVQIMRDHTPDIQLPEDSRRALELLRPDWRLGIVTNGIPAMQRRKIAALGLDDLVDAVIYAEEHGAGGGKPEREPFIAAVHLLGVQVERTVFVGDDEWCDLVGATRVGMRTVFFGSPRHARPSFHADAIAHTLLDVPALADSLVPAERCQHVA
jgi:putative hydrolase of the HAD superfamily